MEKRTRLGEQVQSLLGHESEKHRLIDKYMDRLVRVQRAYRPRDCEAGILYAKGEDVRTKLWP